MDLPALIRQMESFAQVLPTTLRGVSGDDARWKPASGAWSILEVVTHLADEEELDFKVRVESTLRDPEAHWPGIDPEGWAVERDYNDGDLDRSLERFLAERSKSLAWLQSLDAATDWNRSYQHQSGPISAGELMVAWAAHDWLHLRQIAKRRFELCARDGTPYLSRYAGEWGI